MTQITNYATLQTVAADQAHRADLASRMPRFIQLAENEIFRTLALRKVEAKSTGTTSGETLAIPAGCAQLERIEIEASGHKYTLDYTSPNGIEALTGSTDLPTRFTVENGAIRLIAAPAGPYTYSIFYVPLLTALSDVAPTNWLLLNYPDVYLWGTCLQIAIFSGEEGDKATFAPMFLGAIDSVRRFDDRQRFPASGGLQIKPRSVR